MGSAPVLIRVASVDEVLPLRAAVLRDGGSIDSARFDEDPIGLHVAVLDPQLLACATGFPAPHERAENAWRIRGVAVDPARRGQGLGAAVVRALMAEAGVEAYWCSARLSAVGFWERMGFTRLEEVPYPMPHGGLHHTMLLGGAHDSGPPPGAG